MSLDLEGFWKRHPDVIAEVIPKEEWCDRWFILSKKINVLPGEAALWISNGQVRGRVEEGQLIAGGLIDRLKTRFKAGEDMLVMMMETGVLVLGIRLGIDKQAVLTSDPSFFKKLSLATRPRVLSPRRYGDDVSDHVIDSAKQDDIEAREQEIEKQIDAEIEAAAKRRQVVEDGTESERVRAQRMRIERIADEGTAILTKDRESVRFEVRVRVRLVPEDALEVYKLFHASGFLLRADLESSIRRELESRVFATEISRCTAAELRTNPEILARLHGRANEELSGWLGNHGIEFCSISINPAVTASEQAQVIEAEKEAIAEAVRRQHDRELAQVEREYQVSLAREQFAARLSQAKAGGDLEQDKIIQAMLLGRVQSERSRADIAAEIDRVRHQAVVESKRKEEELRLWALGEEWKIKRDELELTGRLEREKAMTKAELDQQILRTQFELNRQWLEAQTSMRIRELEARSIARGADTAHELKLLEIAAQAGALSPQVMAEALRQATIRKALDQGDVAAQAFGRAEEARGHKESFQEGATSNRFAVASEGRMLIQPAAAPDAASGSRPRSTGAGTAELGSTASAPETLVPCPQCKECFAASAPRCPGCGAART